MHIHHYKLKILLISMNYAPELTGIGKYSSEMVDWFVEQGHSVKVICAPPYYPQWKIEKGHSSWKFKIEISLNKRVYWCPVWVPLKSIGLKRLIHLASFALSSFLVILRQIFWRPDVVICIEPPLFNCFSAIITSKFARAKSILHIQDFEIDAAFDLGIIKVGWLKHFIYIIDCFSTNQSKNFLVRSLSKSF